VQLGTGQGAALVHVDLAEQPACKNKTRFMVSP
jgi:hypothetical protein